MNKKLSVLIIMEDFAPVNNCGTIPNTKLVKYLARQDIDITLMISELLPGMNLDENLVPAEMNRIHVLRIPYGYFFRKTVGSARTKASNNGTLQKMKAEKRPVRELLISVARKLYFNIRRLDYLHNGKKVIRRQLKHAKFDVVYSTYPSDQPHQLAEFVMNKRLAGKWIADFRDPMAYETYDRKGYDKSMEAQHRIERLADHITVVSKGAINKFRFFDVSPEKLTVIPNGFDPEDVPDCGPEKQSGNDILRIFYAGTLYAGKRDLDVLFRAISELINEGFIRPEKISAEYAGNDWPTFHAFASRYHLESKCRNYGYIPHSRVMEILSEIDCSIVSSNNTAKDRGVVTGKVFELLVVGKPIITIVTGELAGSELGEIIRECSAGVVFEDANGSSDYPKLKSWLKTAYEEKSATGSVKSHVNTEKRAQYSYSAIARHLSEIFTSVSGGNANHDGAEL